MRRRRRTVARPRIGASAACSSRGGLLADPVGLVFATCWSVADLAAFPELVVDGLHDHDALTLLGRVLQVPVDVRVRERIVAETRGNPLALVEWPRGRTPADWPEVSACPRSCRWRDRSRKAFGDGSRSSLPRRNASSPSRPPSPRVTRRPCGPRRARSASARPMRRLRSTRGSSSSVSACRSGIRSHGRRSTRPRRSPIGRRRTARSRKSPTPTAIPIGKPGIADSGPRPRRRHCDRARTIGRPRPLPRRIGGLGRVCSNDRRP